MGARFRGDQLYILALRRDDKSVCHCFRYYRGLSFTPPTSLTNHDSFTWSLSAVGQTGSIPNGRIRVSLLGSPGLEMPIGGGVDVHDHANFPVVARCGSRWL